MKVGFAGTPEFARVALARLLRSAHQVALVLTQPDRPSGRGMKLAASPVKALALEAGLPLQQPAGLRLDGRFADQAEAAHQALVQASLDVLVVAAYGLILPPSVLGLPRLGCLNIHASLLPRWRGAAPVQRAIEAGDALTGVCIMQMDAGLDTGDVWLTRTVPVHAEETAGALTERLAVLGAEALIEVLDQLGAPGRASLEPFAQPQSGATYAKKIDKAEAQLGWDQEASLLARRVRAFNPVPGASVPCGGERLKVWQARVAQLGATGLLPGTVMAATRQGIEVACGEGSLVLLVVQRAGGKRQAAADVMHMEVFRPGSLL